MPPEEKKYNNIEITINPDNGEPLKIDAEKAYYKKSIFKNIKFSNIIYPVLEF